MVMLGGYVVLWMKHCRIHTVSPIDSLPIPSCTCSVCCLQLSAFQLSPFYMSYWKRKLYLITRFQHQAKKKCVGVISVSTMKMQWWTILHNNDATSTRQVKRQTVIKQCIQCDKTIGDNSRLPRGLPTPSHTYKTIHVMYESADYNTV